MSRYIKQFNARSIFLQDGLELSYASGDALSVDISLSNFGDGVLPAATQLTWSVLLEGKAIKTATAAVTQSVPQGSLGVVGTVTLTLPDVGTTESIAFGATNGAKTLTVTAQFAAGGGGSGFATAVPMNTWNATLFPKHVAGESKSPVMATSATLKEHCGFSNCKLSDGEPSPDAPPALYLTTTMTGALAASVEKAGSVVLLLQGTSSGFFQTAATRFKQARFKQAA